MTYHKGDLINRGSKDYICICADYEHAVFALYEIHKSFKRTVFNDLFVLSNQLDKLVGGNLAANEVEYDRNSSI